MSFNWQQKNWPKFSFSRAMLRDELTAFSKAFKAVKAALKTPLPPEAIAETLTAEAVRTSAIEGVNVDESVVMSSICRAFGVAHTPPGFAKDVRAEGVAKMVIAVREDWNKPLSEELIKSWHGALLENDERKIAIGAFRRHKEPMRVIRTNAYGEMEVRFEAPPSESVPAEMRHFVEIWGGVAATKPADIALKSAFMHPHFESIHPFEDGNGRIGRALVAKTLAEGLGVPLVLPMSTTIARHRSAYYDEINVASHSLDWTSWAAFFIPVLTETLTDFLGAMRFIASKQSFLSKYEAAFSERSRKVILRMFEDGETGVRTGLSAAKWMRMAKVSKPTATRDLAALETSGAIIVEGAGPQTRYRLNCAISEPIDGINDGINEGVLRLVCNHPGHGVPFFTASLNSSKATVERAIAALVAAGKIEHRGSKKTGGYFAK